MTIASGMKKMLVTALLVFAATIDCRAANTANYKTITYEMEFPGATSNVSVDFPVSVQEPLRSAIIDYILERLGTYKSEQLPAPISDKCDEETFKTFLSQLAENLAKTYGEEQREFAESMEDEGEAYTMTWYVNIRIEKAAETDKYVSYVYYFGDYEGGVHGERSEDGITIRKSDGKRITDIFKDDVEEAMQPLLWKYILPLDTPEDERKEYRKGIEEYLEYQKHNLLPLPSITFLTPDGIHLQYYYYSICPWAMGAPLIVLPINEAMPYLTRQAAQLVK